MRLKVIARWIAFAGTVHASSPVRTVTGCAIAAARARADSASAVVMLGSIAIVSTLTTTSEGAVARVSAVIASRIAARSSTRWPNFAATVEKPVSVRMVFASTARHSLARAISVIRSTTTDGSNRMRGIRTVPVVSRRISWTTR